MSTKKYLSYEGLAEYDALIKAEVSGGDESTLSSSKAYTDEQIAAIQENVDGKADSGHSHNSVTIREW